MHRFRREHPFAVSVSRAKHHLIIGKGSLSQSMKYRTLWAVTLAYGAAAIVVNLVFLMSTYLPLVPGLTILWVEIAGGLLAGQASHRLTKRAVAMQGVMIEQNPIARSMFATGDFRLRWTVYAGMFFLGAAFSAISIRLSAVMISILVLLPAFTLPMVLDALNDFRELRLMKAETESKQQS
jgi:hypothetical protein